jgi:addiction module HigA family antidote
MPSPPTSEGARSFSRFRREGRPCPTYSVRKASMGSIEAARRAGLLNGKADLSGNMALRIEKAFGVKMGTLMRMQASYDIAQTRRHEKQIHVRRIQPLADIHA